MSTFLFDYGGTLDTAATHWYYVLGWEGGKKGLILALLQLLR
jgi:hypothetical protein